MGDIRHAIRRLARTPGFTLVALITIALGIGANVAVFNLLDALVLRDLPVAHADELTTVTLVMRNGTEAGLSSPAFEELRDHSDIFASLMGCMCDVVLPVDIDGEVTHNDIDTVTGNFFTELGTQPALGRLLGPSDVDLVSFTRSPVAVLGYRFWQQRFGGDPAVLGRTVRVNGDTLTVIGVAPRGFTDSAAPSSLISSSR